MHLIPLARRLSPLLALAVSACGMPMHNIEAENRAYPWILPVSACDNTLVLASISQRFAHAENRTGEPGLTIDDISAIRETAFRKNGRAYIPRRDCVASAQLSDNTRHAVHYTIVSGVGAYSIGDRVEFCVEGHDHSHLGEPACTRMPR